MDLEFRRSDSLSDPAITGNRQSAVTCKQPPTERSCRTPGLLGLLARSTTQGYKLVQVCNISSWLYWQPDSLFPSPKRIQANCLSAVRDWQPKAVSEAHESSSQRGSDPVSTTELVPGHSKQAASSPSLVPSLHHLPAPINMDFLHCQSLRWCRPKCL